MYKYLKYNIFLRKCEKNWIGIEYIILLGIVKIYEVKVI